jgi:hypothetical protein
VISSLETFQSKFLRIFDLPHACQISGLLIFNALNTDPHGIWKKYKLLSSSVCNFLRLPDIFPFLNPNIHLNSLLLNAFRLYS